MRPPSAGMPAWRTVAAGRAIPAQDDSTTTKDQHMKITSIALAAGLALGASAAMAAPQATPATAASPATPATAPAKATTATTHHKHHHHTQTTAKSSTTKKNDHDADDMAKPAKDTAKKS